MLRVVGNGDLQYLVEDQAAAARAATIEVEHGLVQAALQVPLLDRYLVGPEQPALGERDDPVHTG